MSTGIIAEVIKQQDIAYKIIESDKYQMIRLKWPVHLSE